MTKTKMTNLKDLDKKRLSKIRKEILAAIGGIDRTFVSKINETKNPSPRDVPEKSINLGEGLNYVYGKKPLNSQAEELNPFTSSLQKIKPSADESEKLSWFKSAVVKAKTPKEMNKVIDEVIGDGARLNACSKGEWSFAEYVILGTHFHKLEKSDRKKIMRKLMLSGAEFHDTLLQNKLIREIYNELQPEVQPQIDKKLGELRKAGGSAVQEGALIDIEIDNRTLFMEFSEDSRVEVAKVMSLNKELGSNILKMGNNEVEVKSKKGDIRNYTDMSDGSYIVLEFPTSVGKLNIMLYQDVKNYHQVQVRIADKKIWAELQKRGEEVGKNCLFGGMTVKEAVEIGSFTRCGIWGEKQTTKEIDGISERLSSWVNKIRVGSKETFRSSLDYFIYGPSHKQTVS